MKILIEVHCYNRKQITEQCLKQIRDNIKSSHLRVVNDYSTEYDNEWLLQFTDDVVLYEKKLTINKLKYRLFKYFLQTDYTHLYMCDNDIYHDPLFETVLKKYHNNNLPITLYRSSFIHSFGDRCSRYLKNYDEVSLKTGLYGGASVFLNREHIQKIVDNLPITEDIWDDNCKNIAWDSKIQHFIDNKRLYLITNKSYCEHFGIDGQNHKTKKSDYGLDLTGYLENISTEIWSLIENNLS